MEWKLLLCQNGSLSKDPLESLIDILCNVPGLLEDAENARQLSTSAKEDSGTAWAYLVAKCEDNLSTLAEWRDDWEFGLGRCWYEFDSRQSTSLSPDIRGPRFPTDLYFTNIWRAYEFCTHNALHILLLRLYTRATSYAHDAEHGYQSTTCTSAQSDSLVAELAVDICRCINYFFLEEHRYLGALLFCLFPGQIALQSLDPDSELGRWLGVVLKYGPKWPTHFII
jgi:hypothetical protein